MEFIQNVIEYLLSHIVSITFALVKGGLVFILGWKAAKWLVRIIKRSSPLKKLDDGIQTFLGSFIEIMLKALVVVSVVSVMGVNLSAGVTALASVGLTFGLAFQGALSNFAGGFIILVFKPFKVGDWIDAAGVSGGVKEIQIFNTLLTTGDNKIIIVPNAKLSNDMVVNYSKGGTRRVDWTFTISYGDDYDKAKAVLAQFMSEDKRIKQDPAPFVALNNLADSAVEIVARAWVDGGDYWDVYFGMNERVYKEFGKNGLSFPFPQMDVHITKE